MAKKGRANLLARAVVKCGDIPLCFGFEGNRSFSVEAFGSGVGKY